jgi:phosphoribosylaminoimidazole-succinocarboxamide synthase
VIAGPAVLDTDLPLKLFSRGKVRDTYELGPDQLLMVATDRISAFDHNMPNGIPDRGKVLTQLSIFWFSQTDTFQENHLISGMVPDLPAALKDHRESLAGRFMIFSPATKAETGHDENITFAQLKKELGDELATKLRDASLELYKFASDLAGRRGLILADTKFEFGLLGDDLILIDEALTPDSSRFWDSATYQVGASPDSYDKQFVRDWLTKAGWDKESEPPRLPDDVVAQTRQRYLTAYQRLVGKPLFPPKPRYER